MEPMLYTVKEVAQILKCNATRVYGLKDAGLLPFLKLGQLKCRREAVEEFLRKYEGYDVSDPNNIIYGHHLNDGSMFACVADFSDAAQFNDHRTVYILTPEGVKP